MAEVRVRLFGAFRSFGLGRELVAAVPDSGATVAEVRATLERQMPDEAARSWLAASAFATDERVLDEGDAVVGGASISILPPVCGG